MFSSYRYKKPWWLNDLENQFLLCRLCPFLLDYAVFVLHELFQPLVWVQPWVLESPYVQCCFNLRYELHRNCIGIQGSYTLWLTDLHFYGIICYAARFMFGLQILISFMNLNCLFVKKFIFAILLTLLWCSWTWRKEWWTVYMLNVSFVSFFYRLLSDILAGSSSQ